MSKYENYDRISVNYDKTRTAVGIEIVLGFLASLPQPAGGIGFRVRTAGSSGAGHRALSCAGSRSERPACSGDLTIRTASPEREL